MFTCLREGGNVLSHAGWLEGAAVDTLRDAPVVMLETMVAILQNLEDRYSIAANGDVLAGEEFA